MLKSFPNDIGIEENRTMFIWMSASKGGRFAQVIKGVTPRVKALGSVNKLVKKKININHRPDGFACRWVIRRMINAEGYGQGIGNHQGFLKG
ncbi:MAG: hydrogenase iron-sulfur subunit [Deltaproteobacteria bacterium]|nr:hydrogenase iron-sulfur subunit [Deltaproteobacteria bacterium]